jgi:hypothetical protein
LLPWLLSPNRKSWTTTAAQQKPHRREAIPSRATMEKERIVTAVIPDRCFPITMANEQWPDGLSPQLAFCVRIR